MDWLANMQAWQALPPEVRRAQAWAQIPASVAASMAFEGEPVPLDWIQALHDQCPAPNGRHPVRPPIARFAITRLPASKEHRPPGLKAAS